MQDFRRYSFTMTIEQLRKHLEELGNEYPVTLIINGEYYDLVK